MIGTYAELMARILVEEPFRHACEARFVANFETDSQRTVYLEGEKGVRDRRGDAPCEQLRREIWTQMKSSAKAVEPLQEALFA